MINTEELILGKDYYNYVIANPKLYHLIGWEINSEEDTGIIKDKSTNELRFYWSNNFPENEFWFDQMLINTTDNVATMEAIYLPYIVQQGSEETPKLSKHMRRVVGCTNGCFFGVFGDNVTFRERCERCSKNATKQR